MLPSRPIPLSRTDTRNTTLTTQSTRITRVCRILTLYFPLLNSLHFARLDGPRGPISSDFGGWPVFDARLPVIWWSSQAIGHIRAAWPKLVHGRKLGKGKRIGQGPTMQEAAHWRDSYRTLGVFWGERGAVIPTSQLPRNPVFKASVRTYVDYSKHGICEFPGD